MARDKVAPTRPALCGEPLRCRARKEKYRTTVEARLRLHCAGPTGRGRSTELSRVFFAGVQLLISVNAQSATSHFFQSRGREGGWQKNEATGVFWNKSVFSYRSVVTKNDRKSDVRSFRDRLFREKHCGPRGSRASSHRWQSACLVVRLQKAGTAHYARRRARPARRPHRFEFRTADASGIPPDCRRSSLPSTRLTRQTHAPRGRPRTVWYFLDSTRIRAST